MKDGLLKGTPTVSYSRKIETDIQKVDMTFLEPTDTDADGNPYGDYRLKVQYSTDDIVNGEVANEARKANAQQVYDDYNAYLDYLQGATTYKPDDYGNSADEWQYAAGARATDLRAHDASNPSGLINHDIYLDQQNDTKIPDNTNLTNFSYRRLEDLKYGDYGKASYDTAATDGARTFVAKKDGSDTTTTVANSAQNGLMCLYNFYSPVMGAYNSVYGEFTPYDSTTAGGGVNSTTAPTTVQGAWDAAQNEANRSRQLINTGINAAADLATVKSEVETAIGRDYSGTATSGLKLTRSGSTSDDPVGTNTWEANNVYTDALTHGDHYAYNEDGQAPLVAFNSESSPTNTSLIAFAKTSAGLDTADKIQEVLSADTVFEERFKDVKTGAFGATSGAGSQVKFTVTETNRPAEAGTTLGDLWDTYVAQTKRKMLIDKKIELVQSCIQDTNGVALPGANITVSETDAARDIEEAQRALVLLKKEQAEIMVDYNKAKKDYEDSSKAVADKIKKMNELQRMVDAANKEYISDLNGVNKLQTTASSNDFYYTTSNPTNDTGDAIITTVTKGGVADSPVETILKNCLINTYGVAHKADAPAPTYTSATNPTIYQTYSQAQTKTDIDKYTTANDDGTTEFDVLTADFDTSEFEGDGTEDATETAVKNAPYFRLNQADNMMTYRKKQADDKKANFDAAAAQMALFDADETSSSEGIVLYIGLGDVITKANPLTENDDEHKWQYVGDATETKSAKEFDFGYTSILGAGETSSQLIKYVKFDDKVTQKDFLDMTFDVNVGVESAQVAYNGTIAGAEAARSSLTPIVPSEESYATSDKVVGWVAKDGNVGSTDTDPDPKTEATDAVGTTYNVKANGVDDETVTKITPVVIEGEAYEYKYTDASDNVYYGQSATGTFKKVVNDAAATKEFVDPVEAIDVTDADAFGTKYTPETAKDQDNADVAGVKVEKIEPVTVGANTYKYKIVSGDDTYFGTTKAGTFTKHTYNDATSEWTPEAATTITVTF